jgi:Mg/Co/Ni transporter MgtE
VPTCSLTDDLRLVRERVRAAGWEECIVVNEQRIVLGRLGRRALSSSDDKSVEEAMSDAPRTMRPNIALSDALERVAKQQHKTALVTTSVGRLIGVVRPD